MAPTLRSYRPTDRRACLDLFDGNTPEFFLPHERAEFEDWLDAPGEYLVIEDAGQVVACGGIWQEEGRVGLAWGMVSHQHHRQGFGSMLLRARLGQLRELGAKEVHLDTTQHSAPFFARHGFAEVRRVSDGYGPGMDRVDMLALLDQRPT